MDTKEFLQRVVTTPEGYFNLCMRSPSHIWHEEWYSWPQQTDLIVSTAMQAAPEYDVYFSSYLYSQQDSHKVNVLPSRTLQQDLDGADPTAIPVTPTCLIQTSPNRYQGYWLLTEALDLELHELLSRRLAYAIPNCDHSGWSLGHKVRLPGTVNYKYLDGPHPIDIVNSNTRQYAVEELELLPDVDSLSLSRFDSDFVTNPPSTPPDGRGPYEIVESIKDRLTAAVYGAYQTSVPAADRSAALWALMTQAFKAGLDRNQVYWIASHSANNKFDRLRYHSERDLAKDVLRAEHSVKTQATDIRAIINDVRRQTKMLINERHKLIADIVYGKMREEGTFVRMKDSRRYYIPTDKGLPIFVGPRSEQLDALLDVRYGLNRTELSHEYTKQWLISNTNYMTESGTPAALSYYDPGLHHILIHSGQKAVYSVDATSINIVTDGAYDVVFPWSNLFSPFAANLSASNDIDWGQVLFGGIDNIVNLDPDEAMVLLKVWFMFILFRNAARTKPILALFGQPSSGKTTLACRIYQLIYGQNLEVSGLTEPQSFDMASTSLPVFVIDNADTWEKWLPDRLAQSARTTDVLVRKLYSDLELIRIRRQAVVVITAHDPKFTRADVVSRLMILSMVALTETRSETEILDNILNNRNKLWGAILRDCQLILANPLIYDPTTPLMRIQDFAKVGDWVALGLDIQSTFRAALRKLKGTQYSQNLVEHALLVNAITKWLQPHTLTQPITQEVLFQQLFDSSDEKKAFLVKYRNSIVLGKTLSNLQSSLSDNVCLLTQFANKGGRLWMMEPLTPKLNEPTIEQIDAANPLEEVVITEGD